MTVQPAAIVVLAVLAVAALLYWLLVVTEGAYLGARVVSTLYDRGAGTYDAVKRFDRVDELAFLANPLFERLAAGAGPGARVLDVATGTARLPLALLGLPDFGGTVVGVDLSAGMLAVAAAKTSAWADRYALVHHAAAPLPFADESFDAVTILEALEFLPDRSASLREAVRVLAPGGWLLATNRIGIDARLMPWRTDPPAAFEARLAAIGLVDVVTRPWMTYYALVLGRRPGAPAWRRSGPWHDALRCPRCGSTDWAPSAAPAGQGDATLEAHASLGLVCRSCGALAARREGVWQLPAPGVTIRSGGRATGRRR